MLTPRSAAIFLFVVGACRTQAPPVAEEVALPPKPPTAAPLPPLPAPTPAEPGVRYLPGSRFRPIEDGKTGAVVGNVRVVYDAGGARVVDTKRQPDLGRYALVAPALGGFVVFVGERTVRVAPRFDGPLTTVAEVADADVAVGHRAIFVRSSTDKKAAARYFEAPSGRALPLPVPDARGLYGTPSGLVGAYDGKGALFVSRSGGPWKPVPGQPIDLLRFDGRDLVAHGQNQSDFAVTADDTLAPFSQRSGTMLIADNLAAFYPLPDGNNLPPVARAELLVGPFTRALGKDHVVRVDSEKPSTLFVYDAATGKLLRSSRTAFDGRENCFPIRGGTAVFVGCNTEKEMTLYRIDRPDREPTIVRTFPATYTQNFGSPGADVPLVLAKTCDGKPEKGAFCIEKDGTFVDKKLPPAEANKLPPKDSPVHVAASPSGEAMAFYWAHGDGDLVVADLARGKARTIRKADLDDRLRWDASSVRDGHVRFFLEGTDVLDIGPDDRCTIERLPGKAGGFGARGLHVAPDGAMRETDDAGKTWIPVASPPGGFDPEARVGCYDTGCGTGEMMRFGWARR